MPSLPLKRMIKEPTIASSKTNSLTSGVVFPIKNSPPRLQILKHIQNLLKVILEGGGFFFFIQSILNIITWYNNFTLVGSSSVPHFGQIGQFSFPILRPLDWPHCVPTWVRKKKRVSWICLLQADTRHTKLVGIWEKKIKVFPIKVGGLARRSPFFYRKNRR